jgi:hypothetical protein
MERMFLEPCVSEHTTGGVAAPAGCPPSILEYEQRLLINPGDQVPIAVHVVDPETGNESGARIVTGMWVAKNGL